MKQMKRQNKNNDMLSLGKDSQIAVVRQTQTGLRASRSRTLFMWYIIPCSSSTLSLTELQQCEMNSSITGTFDERCVYKAHVCNSSPRKSLQELESAKVIFLDQHKSDNGHKNRLKVESTIKPNQSVRRMVRKEKGNHLHRYKHQNFKINK